MLYWRDDVIRVRPFAAEAGARGSEAQSSWRLRRMTYISPISPLYLPVGLAAAQDALTHILTLTLT